MPCIRRRFNYGNIWLAPHVIENKKALAGQTVDVLLPDGDFKRVLFIGFINATDIRPDMRRVKLVNIEAFNPVASVLGDWIDYGPDCCMLGVYSQHCAYLVLQDGLPVVWCDIGQRKTKTPAYKAGVVSITPLS